MQVNLYLPDDINNRLIRYMNKNRITNRSAAIQALMKYGFFMESIVELPEFKNLMLSWKIPKFQLLKDLITKGIKWEK